MMSKSNGMLQNTKNVVITMTCLDMILLVKMVLPARTTKMEKAIKLLFASLIQLILEMMQMRLRAKTSMMAQIQTAVATHVLCMWMAGASASTWTQKPSLLLSYAVLVEVVQQLPQMTLMITPLRENHAAQMKTVKKDSFAETKKSLVAGWLYVLCSKPQLTMMAVVWTNTEKLPATGTSLQVIQLRALILVSTEEIQDSGALMQIVIRLEYGEMQKALKREHL